MNKKIIYVLIIVFAICIPVAGIYFYISSTTPTASFTYVGENVSSIQNFPTDKGLFYSWDLTTTNLYANGIGIVTDRTTQALTSKYPELATITGPSGTILHMDCTGYDGKLDRQLVVIYANNNLTSDQIQSLTNELNTIVAPAIIEHFS